jgi:DNA mismatch repair protein MutS
VKRAVIETVTPGAAFSDDLLDVARNNYLCALHALGGEVGIAAADLSTGELRLVRCLAGDADASLARLAPRA